MTDMRWLDAICRVLRESGAAMHYSEIADEIAEQGLRTQLGATPHNTVSAYLSRNPDFVRVGRGEYMLSDDAVSSERVQQAEDTVGDGVGDEVERRPGVISAFGMFWRRAEVNWKSGPSILGQQTLNSDVVDFGERIGVYLLHDGRDTVYVGRASERPLARRLYEHTRDRLNGRWDRFSWFGVKAVQDDGTLTLADLSPSASDWIQVMEALLIEGLEPPQNRRRGDDFAAVEYVQVVDPDVRRAQTRALLADLHSRLEDE